MNEIVPDVYSALHRMAQRHMRRERAGHTLQPTALVHEALLRLADESAGHWEDPNQFLRSCATVMRRILINHAVGRRAVKRGGRLRRVPLDDVLAAYEERATDLVAMDDALRRLAEVDEQMTRVVELRFFLGLTAEKTADVLGVSTRTVERNWRLAKAWLRTEIEGEPSRRPVGAAISLQ
jgi:RNA polymerase sigma factor (TIGR02999 family)